MWHVLHTATAAAAVTEGQTQITHHTEKATTFRRIVSDSRKILTKAHFFIALYGKVSSGIYHSERVFLHSETRGDGGASGTDESLVRCARSCEPSCVDASHASGAGGALAYSAVFDSPLWTSVWRDPRGLRHLQRKKSIRHRKLRSPWVFMVCSAINYCIRNTLKSHFVRLNLYVCSLMQISNQPITYRRGQDDLPKLRPRICFSDAVKIRPVEFSKAAAVKCFVLFFHLSKPSKLTT